MKKKICNCFKKYILIIAKQKYPQLRTRKYSLNYYLTNFVIMLNDVVKWKSLMLINKNCQTYHYKTIQNEYNKWCNDNIF